MSKSVFMRLSHAIAWSLLALAYAGCEGSPDGAVSPDPAEETATPSKNGNCMKLVPLSDFSNLPTTSAAKVFGAFQVLGCDGNPLHQRLQQSNFKLTLDGKAPSVEAQPVYAPSPRQFRYFTALMLDVSGSITQTPDGLKNVTEAAKAFIGAALKDQGQGSVAIALYTFDGRAEARMLSDFTTSETILAERLALIATPAACRTNGFCLNSSTNLYGGFEKGLSVVDAALASASAPIKSGAIVVFTDGSEQAHLGAYADAPRDVRATKNSVFTIGLAGSPDFDEAALRTFGKNGYYSTADVNELGAKFTEVGARINDFANSYYAMRLCSARHEGTGKLEVQATAADGRQASLKGSYTVAGYVETLACDAHDASDDPSLGNNSAAVPAGGNPAAPSASSAECIWTNSGLTPVPVISIAYSATCRTGAGSQIDFSATDTPAPGTRAYPGVNRFYHDFSGDARIAACLGPLQSTCQLQTSL